MSDWCSVEYVESLIRAGFLVLGDPWPPPPNAHITELEIEVPSKRGASPIVRVRWAK